MRRIVVIGLLLLGCEEPVTPAESTLQFANDDRVEEAIDPSFEATEEQPTESHLDEAELARTERTFEYDPARDALPVAAHRIASIRARRALTAAQLEEIRERGWNLEAHPASLDELREATVAGLHRISASEVEWVNERDLFGFWEVIGRVRMSHCDNTRFSSRARVRITQCQTASGAIIAPDTEDTVPDAEETYLSAMRRASRFVMGVSHSRRRIRLRWTRYVTLDCEEPDGFPERRDWDGLRENCLSHASLSRQLVEGTLHRDITGRVRPITWGGRCDRGPGYACDDPGACGRGLAVIPNTGTSNRFWCRPGIQGCSPWIEHNGQLYSDELCARIEVRPRRLPLRRRLGQVRQLEPEPEPVVEPVLAAPMASFRSGAP